MEFLGGVELVCFIDFSKPANNKRDVYEELSLFEYTNDNLFFYPVGSSGGKQSDGIAHLDIAATTLSENPLCFTNVNEKITFTIEKDFNEALVTIS